jgi:hypothetical protein
MAQVKALETGDLAQATTLTELRFYMFRHFGIVPPLQWLSLSPGIEVD